MKLSDVARNPLGIIGLFISLIYGFANWMLGSTANTLVPSERIIIIWFIVLFPLLILGAFCYLVINHHGKLYAPKDYNKDESFLQTLSSFDSFVRLSTETFSSTQKSSEESLQSSDVKNGPENPIDESVSNVESPTDASEAPAANAAPIQATEDVIDSNDAAEGADAPSLATGQAAGNDLDLIEHAKNQKQLAQMREVFELTQHFIKTDERFAGVEVKPDVKMGGTGVVYDAAAYTDAGLQCLEVKYLRTSSGFKNLLIKHINQARTVKMAVSPADFYLRLVIVYDWNIGLEKELRAILKSVSPMLQGFIKVELIARSSVSI